MNISSEMISLWGKLRNKKFRDAFVASQFKRSIPFQVIAIRKRLGWSQEQLAKASELTQGAISRAENPDYGNLTFNSVLRIAAGLDLAVVIEFVPFSKFLQIFGDRSEDFPNKTFCEEDEILLDSEAPKNYVLKAEAGSLNLTGSDAELALGSVANALPNASQPSTEGMPPLGRRKDVRSAENSARVISAQEQEVAQEIKDAA